MTTAELLEQVRKLSREEQMQLAHDPLSVNLS